MCGPARILSYHRIMLSPVGSTSCWVAAARALESESPDALFSDPYARRLAGETGLAMVKSAAGELLRSADPRNAYLSIRTRFIDDAVARAVRERGIAQVVMVAAGMDARAFRFDWPAELRWFEVDRAEIFEQKEAVLAKMGAVARCRRAVVRADLEHEWSGPLVEAGFDAARPALFVIEGLLVYLEAAAVERIMETVAELAAAAGSGVVADVVNQDMLTSVYTREMMARLAGMGCGWRFGTNDPRGFFERFGWQAVTVNTPDEPAVGHGRWPHPRVPESVAGIPRSYFVSGWR
jgi:methyltransferase (TIGR00027 family)